MGSSTIDEQLVKQTIRDIYETERAFVDCKLRVRRKGPQAILNTGIGICHLLRDSLKFEQDDYAAKGTAVDLFIFCQKYQRMLRGLHKSIIRFLPRVSEREYPLEIVRPLESRIRQFESNFALILDPYDGATFVLTAWPDIYRQYLDQLQPYVPNKYLNKRMHFPKWFVFLSFPRASSKNPLLHSITLSHEISHLFDYINGISEGLSSEIRIPKDEFNKLVKSILTSRIPVPGYELMLMPRTYADFYTRDVLESAIMQQCTDVIQKWVTEIVADLIAIRSFGPAYLLAFAEHSLALGVMDRDSDEHPNSRMRLKLILRELRNLDYFRQRKYKQDLVLRLNMWEGYAKKKVSIERGLHHEVVTSSISRSIPKIVRKIRLITRGKEYHSSSYRREVPRLVELLKHGIVPCELIDAKTQTTYPPSLAGILNAGYMTYFSELNSICKLLHVRGESGEIQGRRKLDELVLKAIESTEIWQAWPKDQKVSS